MKTKKELTKIIQKILLESSDKKLLRKTHRGEIYEFEDKILKITSDGIEYENAKILIEHPSKFFVKYFSAQPITVDRFELSMEKLIPLTNNECQMVDLIQNSLGVEHYMLDDNKRFRFIKELKENPDYYSEFATYNEMLQMINLLKRMYLEAKQRNITLLDLRCENMGKTAENNIVHFDLGAG